ncbi:DUF6750 family protein [Kiloniella sp.]|uniref:DUF6750 family protein n=1 Tax=Kiloniella sp. TaxID=1938587 RepID=UPI003B029A67
MFSTLKRVFTTFLASTGFYLSTSSLAHAATLNEVFTALAESLSSLPTLLSIICYVVGIILVISGFAYANKAKNFPQQAEVSTGIWRIVVGVCLIILPTIISAVAGSFGTAASAPGIPTF